MIDNLEFAYVDGLRKDESAETAMRINVDMWLSPLEKEINDKNVVVCVVFLSHDKRDIFLSGANEGLQIEFIKRMKQFVI